MKMTRAVGARGWLVATTAALFVLVVGSSAGAMHLGGSAERGAMPTPAEPIVGPAIKIPAVLFESGAPGSASLVTPAQADRVAAEMWKLWDGAEVASNTRALTQLASPGPLLAGTLNACASAGGRCTFEARPRQPKALLTVVPLQRSYPIYFLSEVRTTAWSTTGSSDLAVHEPWLDIRILTKASARAQWKLSFVTGSDGLNRTLPSLLPTLARTTGPGGDSYNEPAIQPWPVPRSRFLSSLASYWQSYMDTGRAPAHGKNVFVDDGYTSGVGYQLAKDRQGSVYIGHRENFKLSVDPRAGHWEFSVGEGFAMECGAIVDHATFTPLTGLLSQNSDESNWGVPLAPGQYRQISSATDRETCIYPIKGGLDATGDLSYRWGVTGKQAKNGAILADLDTQFGILADQLQVYARQFEQCKQGQAPCTAAFAGRAEQEFAKFSNDLITDRFPTSVGTDVTKLATTSRATTLLLGRLRADPTNKALLARFQPDEALLARRFKVLVNTLSKS